MLDMAALGLRGFLFLIGGVVLGLSISLAKQQELGPIPSETGFSSFMGALGFAVSAFGLLALWLDRIKATVVMSMDAIVSALYLASGIALSISLREVRSCTDADRLSVQQRATNKILGGGCEEREGGTILFCPGALGPGQVDLTPTRCHVARADYVFQFLGFATGLAMIALGHVLARRSGSVASARAARPRV